jgi:hypothetical protein
MGMGVHGMRQEVQENVAKKTSGRKSEEDVKQPEW